ncbi:insulinase family protein [Rheinheimera sp. MMS21-TC3]|uniref:insulinase family protein n=1 Tax=Rheinheimera sp. MMS21-TC3 TaxID=3072790 RepID=UPI0028C503CA|nr:insulinase family protein [Rheinheimera sp. MMS21-TC3]WNO60726.1 insulinase family protein [Rheinheimera sp. MMS21-TC3]
MKNQQLLQSVNDRRSYQHLLLENGLAVLLIQQTDAKKSAAALTVNVGHFDDPNERQGLAHFLEHMLFLGSKNHPKPGEYQQFISHHGGSHNAWTGTEHSSFFFDINNDYFSQAIARFSDMFTQPLLSPEHIEKERHAIEAEFSLKLKDDSRRIYQVHKETVNPAHPFAKFSVGNLSTLADLPNESLHQAVVHFFQQQYSAKRMTLVLVSPLPLDEQRRYVEKYFTAIANQQPVKPMLTEPLYLPEQQGIQLNIRPHKDSQKLVVSFALPDIQTWYKHKIISFLAHLIGDEADGSLLSYLKQRAWVNQLSAGGGIDGSNYKDFTIAFELTDQGLSQRDAIVSSLFSYLALLKSKPLPIDLYQEKQILLEWAYLYQEPADELETASHLSINMQHYPVTDIIFGDYRMEAPNESLYQHILQYFCSTNMRLMLVASKVAVDKQAQWYHTPYSTEPIATELLQQLNQAPLLAELHLPKPNPYLTDNLSLLDKSAHMAIPKQLLDTEFLSIWYKADTEFNSPKGHIFVQLSLANSQKSNSHLAAIRLWVELFQDNINQEFYPATAIDLVYNVHVHRQGISIHTSGLAANQLLLLTNLLEKMPEQQFSPPRFLEIKRQLIRHWKNSSKSKPVPKLFGQLSAILQPSNPEIIELAQALDTLSFNEFMQFHKSLFEKVHIESLMIGNWLPTEASKLTANLQHWQHKFANAAPTVANPVYKIQGQGPVWLQIETEHDDHALVIYLPAQETTAVTMALFMLANHVLSAEYFHQLRTEQQLGYLVGTGYAPINTLPGIVFYVQSPTANCHQLYQATVAFFRSFLKETENLSASDFVVMKQGLQTQLSQTDGSLGARAKRFWLALGQQDYSFSLTENILQALTQLSLEQFIAFLQQLLLAEYDVIFLATDPKPALAHIKTSNSSELKQLLQQTKIAFDSLKKLS